MVRSIMILFIASVCISVADNYGLVDEAGRKTTIKPVVLNQKEYLAVNRYFKAVFPGSVFNSATYKIKLHNNSLTITPSTFYLLYNSGNSNYMAQMNLPAIKYSGDLLVPLRSFFLSLNQFPDYRVTVEDGIIKMSNSSDKDIVTGETVSKDKLKKSNTEKQVTNKNNYNIAKQKEEKIPDGDKYLEELPEDDELLKASKAGKSAEEGHQLSKITDSEQLTPVLTRSFSFTSAGFYDKLDIIAGIDQGKILIPEKETNTGNKKSPDTNDSIIDLSYPPNLYVIPKNLIRKELEDIKTKDVKN